MQPGLINKRFPWRPDTFDARIEKALRRAISSAIADGCPPKLGRALDYAVFPGGGRLRPLLGVAVATACGDEVPCLTDASMSALELLHCASLVHDDLTCFDDADLRRGKPALHVEFGEQLGVLTGDGLIVLAFRTLTRERAVNPERVLVLLERVTRAVGTNDGIVSGQAWEVEKVVDLKRYHRAKTAALFEAAAGCGALASGSDPEPWELVGRFLGEAYQAADDIADLISPSATTGKSGRRDPGFGRPSLAIKMGVEESSHILRQLLEQAYAAVPACVAQESFRSWLRDTTKGIIADRLGLRDIAFQAAK